MYMSRYIIRTFLKESIAIALVPQMPASKMTAFQTVPEDPISLASKSKE